MKCKSCFIGSLTALVFGLMSCNDISFSGKGNDVPTAGEIILAVDYSDSFVIAEQMDMFRRDYPNAKIETRHLCEMEIIRQLVADSFRSCILNRPFTLEEQKAMEAKDIRVRGAMAGRTSIALIVNPANPMSELSQNQVRMILSGELNRWPEGNDRIQVVFDAGCGSNFEYFRKKWFEKTPFGTELSQKSTPREVIQYISSHPNALGFVGLNWIADKSDSSSIKLARSVKVLKIENPDKKGFFLPFQSQIVAGEYPFVQEIWMYDVQGYTGLAQGFISYVSSQPGQIMMKKSGLVPAKDHGRTIELSTE